MRDDARRKRVLLSVEDGLEKNSDEKWPMIDWVVLPNIVASYFDRSMLLELVAKSIWISISISIEDVRHLDFVRNRYCQLTWSRTEEKWMSLCNSNTERRRRRRTKHHVVTIDLTISFSIITVTYSRPKSILTWQRRNDQFYLRGTMLIVLVIEDNQICVVFFFSNPMEKVEIQSVWRTCLFSDQVDRSRHEHRWMKTPGIFIPLNRFRNIY